MFENVRRISRSNSEHLPVPAITPVGTSGNSDHDLPFYLAVYCSADTLTNRSGFSTFIHTSAGIMCEYTVVMCTWVAEGRTCISFVRLSWRAGIELLILNPRFICFSRLPAAVMVYQAHDATQHGAVGFCVRWSCPTKRRSILQGM